MLKRLLLVDSGFHSFDGHQYNYLRCLVGEAERRGVSCHVIANRALESSLRSELAAVPAFDFIGVELITDFSENQTVNYNYNFVHFNLRFFMSLTNAVNQLPPLDADTAVFFTTANFRHVLGILNWLSLYPEENRPRAVVLLRDRDHLPERSAPLHRLVLPILAAPRFGARFCSESPAMTAHYAGLAGTEVDLIPVPADAKIFGRPVAARASGPVRIAFLGQARISKGFQLLPQICRLVLAEHDRARFSIQIQTGTFDPEHDRLVKNAESELRALAGERVSLIDRSIDYGAYVEALFSADIVLLPYNPQTYRSNASAVFVEALAAGRVVVVPADTWMSKEAERAKAGIVAFLGHGPQPIAAAIGEAIGRIDALGQRALEARPGWIAEHDAARLVSYVCEPNSGQRPRNQ